MAKFTSGTWLMGPHTALLLPVTCGPSPLGGGGVGGGVGAAGREEAGVELSSDPRRPRARPFPWI